MPTCQKIEPLTFFTLQSGWQRLYRSNKHNDPYPASTVFSALSVPRLNKLIGNYNLLLGRWPQLEIDRSASDIAASFTDKQDGVDKSKGDISYPVPILFSSREMSLRPVYRNNKKSTEVWKLAITVYRTGYRLLYVPLTQNYTAARGCFFYCMQRSLSRYV